MRGLHFWQRRCLLAATKTWVATRKESELVKKARTGDGSLERRRGHLHNSEMCIRKGDISFFFWVSVMGRGKRAVK